MNSGCHTKYIQSLTFSDAEREKFFLF